MDGNPDQRHILEAGSRRELERGRPGQERAKGAQPVGRPCKAIIGITTPGEAQDVLAIGRHGPSLSVLVVAWPGLPGSCFPLRASNRRRRGDKSRDGSRSGNGETLRCGSEGGAHGLCLESSCGKSGRKHGQMPNFSGSTPKPGQGFSRCPASRELGQLGS